MKKGLATVAQLNAFDTLIDARTPSEFALDHLPGAVNRPVLSDAERVEVGTLYKQSSPFAAKRIGAACVASNIAAHLRQHYSEQAKNWRPLVYCWRGGKRSGAFVHILREIGWDAHQLEGGYKAWRRHVVEQLAAAPAALDFIVLSGPTGSAKSRILEALERCGAQVLHLEALAAHKGSVLGKLPHQAQPSQKMFESRLYSALTACDAARPVYVEAESRRIGAVQLPDAVLHAIRAAPCLRIDAEREVRAEFLLGDYPHFLQQPQWLLEQLEHLRRLVSNDTLEHWRQLIAAGAWRELVSTLLEQHYDPLYQRSQERNYRDYSAARTLRADSLDAAAIENLARAILAIAPS